MACGHIARLQWPAPSVRADGFSARWTRTVNFEYTGNYRFYMTSDDGMRIWVDDILLIDQWFDRQDAWMTGNLYLTAGALQSGGDFDGARGAFERG